ncbi:MAG TPA: 6-phosphogluconolactonase [Caulobacteraceae bacterium]|jgi:6-phosphogluconolactonase|nr:6-phosphogluconolactonase [Caulobacteraceae bacterium]
MVIAGTTERVFADAESQAAAAADRIAGAIGEDGGDLVLTGGSTPGPVYDLLSKRSLPWDRVRITLSDERWVPPDHADSNERLVRERLLRGPAAAARFIPLKTGAPTPEAAVGTVAAALAAIRRPFSCVLLGMGDDGHIASLFPGDAMDETLRPDGPDVVRPARAPNGTPRLSLTLAALLDSRLILVLIRGEAKRAVLRDALAGAAPHLPIAALLRQARCPVEVFWAP